MELVSMSEPNVFKYLNNSCFISQQAVKNVERHSFRAFINFMRIDNLIFILFQGDATIKNIDMKLKRKIWIKSQ
jgi:hypothetical protein